MRYHPLEIKVQSSVRFEEFDFSYYNRTSFAGLENGLPNCYCNALLQVMRVLGIRVLVDVGVWVQLPNCYCNALLHVTWSWWFVA